MDQGDYFLAHRWSLCPMCGPIVICGGCDNNMCNGGAYCDGCDSAFDLQRAGAVPADLAEQWALAEAEAR